MSPTTIRWLRPRRALAAACIAGACIAACASEPPDPGSSDLREGEAALAEGAGQRAVDAYRQAVAVAPKDLRAWRGLLEAQLATGDGEAALASLSWLETWDPGPVDVCPTLALVVEGRLSRGELPEAEMPARRALEEQCDGASPRLSRVLSALAVESQRAGEVGKTIALYEEAIRLEPAEPGRFLLASELLLAEGLDGQAVSLLARGLEAHPDDRALRDLMVRALTR